MRGKGKESEEIRGENVKEIGKEMEGNEGKWKEIEGEREEKRKERSLRGKGEGN